MTHLRIELNTITENVTSDVIHKLYETAKAIIDAEEANEVEESLVSLKGNLLVSNAYGDEIDWLEAKFPDLHITAGARYIRFADDAVYARLSLYLGDGTGITSSEITNTNIFSNTTDSTTNNIYFTNNTSITLFNELGLLSQVVDIPLHAFGGCSNLISIDLSNILTVGTLAFLLSGLSGLLNLPSIRNIGNNAFVETNITSVVLGSNLQTIQEFAFNRCYSLTSVTGLLNVTFIPLYCFYMDSALQSVDLSSCTSIGLSAFLNCSSLTGIDVSNVTSVGSGAFQNCTSLTSVDLSSCTSIGQQGFKDCTSLTSVDLSSLTSYNNLTFEGCTHLASVTLTSSLTTIGYAMFYGCNTLSSIDLSHVTEIKLAAFLNCTSLTSVDISSVVNIGVSAFNGCTALTTTDLSSCTSISSKAFSGCTSLGTGLTLELNLTGLTSYPNDAFYNTKYSRLILHSPLLTSKYDPRYPLYEYMSNLTYLDLSDFLVGTDAFDNTNTKYYEGSFYGNTSLVTFIYPLNVNSLKTNLKYGRTVSTYRYAIILNTTPPSLDISDSNNPPSEWFTNSNLHIYVPDSAKATYLADSDWASISGNNGSVTISDRLHGLSELPAGVWTTGLASQYLTPAQLATS